MPDHRDPERLGHHLRRGDADPQPGEAARPDPDRDRGEPVERDARAVGTPRRSPAPAARRAHGPRRAAPRRAARRRGRSATLTTSVAVSNARTCITRPLLTRPVRRRRTGQRRARDHAGSDGTDGDAPRRRSRPAEVESHLEPVDAERAAHDVAPLDDGHGVVVGVVEPEVEQAPARGRGGRRRRARPRTRPAYSRASVNVGLTTGSVDAEPVREAPREHRLARAEVAGEQHDVAAEHVLAHDARERLGASLLSVVTVTSPTRSRSRGLRARQRALHHDEVAARLRERGAAAAQHRRRVQRGDRAPCRRGTGTPGPAAS